MTDFTYNEAKEILTRVGIENAPALLRALQCLKLITFKVEHKPISIDIVDAAPVVIMRNGKVVYTELDDK